MKPLKKNKRKAAPVHAGKAYRRSDSMVKLTPRPLYPRRNNPWTAQLQIAPNVSACRTVIRNSRLKRQARRSGQIKYLQTLDIRPLSPCNNRLECDYQEICERDRQTNMIGFLFQQHRPIFSLNPESYIPTPRDINF